MKNRLRRNSLFISATVIALVGALYYFRILDNFENRSLDWRFQVRGEQKSKVPLVVAEFDDESFQTIGKWPWPRRIHAKLIDICRRAGAKAVVYDVLFLEEDRYDPSNDRLLGEAIRRNGRTVFGFDFNRSEEQIVEENEKGEAHSKTVVSIVKEEPIPAVQKNTRIGFVNSWPDDDGYMRRGHLTYEFEGSTYTSLNLETAALFQGKPALELLKDVPYMNNEVVSWGSRTAEVLVNWRGAQDSFDHYSCAKILDPNIPDEWKFNWLKDKIVIFGSTALGLYDHYPNAYSASMPGLYLHANIIDNLLSGEFLTPRVGFVTLGLILFFGLAGGFLVFRMGLWSGASSVVVLLGAFWALAYFLLAKKRIYIELVAPSVSLVVNYMAVFFYRFIVEQREKAGIKKAFGVYVNPHVVDQIAKNPDGLKLGGEMREMTVMFSDVAGFTTISEKLSPQELVQLLNLYLTAMTDTIMQHDGTVDKYEGDAIMAFWGAPLPQPDHAKLACISVLENRVRLKELNAELEKKGMQKLVARCGLNTGPMNVGNMGSSQKFNYTVMGDAVNLASRLEGANKQYGTYLMISETTYEQVKSEVEVRELDLLRVKGKKIPIKVYELLSLKGQLSDDQKKGVDLFNEGLALYRQRQFKESMKKFGQVREILPEDGPSETYLRRAQDYLDAPPAADWDGVYVMTTK
jgi:adenylate cyclase